MKQMGDSFPLGERKPMEQSKRAVFGETFRSADLLRMTLWKVSVQELAGRRRSNAFR